MQWRKQVLQLRQIWQVLEKVGYFFDKFDKESLSDSELILIFSSVWNLSWSILHAFSGEMSPSLATLRLCSRYATYW